MKLFDAAFSTLTRSMNVRMIRQSMLNNNLANVDTPTYVPQEVDFNAAMAQSIPEEERTLSGTQNAHIEDMPDSAELMFESRAVTEKSQPFTIAAPNRALMAIRWTLILPCPTSLKTRFNTMPPPAPSRKNFLCLSTSVLTVRPVRRTPWIFCQQCASAPAP